MALTCQEVKRASEPKVYLCAADNDDNLPGGSYCAPCAHELFVLECNESGYGRASINGRWFEVKPRMAYVVLSGDAVAYYANKENPRRGYFLIFGGGRIGRLLERAGITADKPELPEDKFDEILDLMKRLYALRGMNDVATELRRTGCLYELLGVIMRGCTEDSCSPDIERAASIMEACYHTNLTMESIAAEVGFDRAYFSTAFKKHKGVSPHEYLTGLRINRACEIIESNDTASVGMVAESVGLGLQNFARIFKGVTGKTPREYKALVRARKETK